jgi:hypothetical protein
LAGIEGDLLLLEAAWEAEAVVAGLPRLLYEEPHPAVVSSAGGEQNSARLQLPIGNADLIGRVEAVGGFTLDSSVAIADAGLNRENESQISDEESAMQDSVAQEITVIELTEIVEEGLPLDQLPDPPENPPVVSGKGEDLGEIDDFFADDDFGASLSDLEEKGEDVLAVSDQEKAVSDDRLGSSSVVTEGEEAIVGDLDALLDDTEFAEVEIPPAASPEISVEVPDESNLLAELEDLSTTNSVTATDDAGTVEELGIDDPLLDDPVLEELKKAGLSPADVGATADQGASVIAVPPESSDVNEVFPDTEDANDSEGLNDDLRSAAGIAETTENLSPDIGISADDSVAEDTMAVPAGTPEDESPEDYVVDEDPAGQSLSADVETATVANGVEAALGDVLANTVKNTDSGLQEPLASVSRPEICAEPQIPDFSRQIEDLTREWSKQLLQSTYASMDKMIQAIGDLAPTIVDRVAREIIPPLAEQVIKAEIARLEQKLEEEESAETPPAVESQTKDE